MSGGTGILSQLWAVWASVSTAGAASPEGAIGSDAHHTDASCTPTESAEETDLCFLCCWPPALSPDGLFTRVFPLSRLSLHLCRRSISVSMSYTQLCPTWHRENRLSAIIMVSLSKQPPTSTAPAHKCCESYLGWHSAYVQLLPLTALLQLVTGPRGERNSRY